MQLNINLMPWRERQRQMQIRRFLLSLFAMSVVAVFCIAGMSRYLQLQLDIQQGRVEQLTRWDSKLGQQQAQLNAIEKEIVELNSEFAALRNLDSRRYLTALLVSLLPSVLPDHVYLEQIHTTDKQVRLHGIASTTEQLSTMLAQLKRTPMAESVAMQSVLHHQSQSQQNYQVFTLTFELVEPKHD
ncbi:PilN domain-containing protein [Vibrio coralliilyticus]|uniref:PilN domain-containing protein n=1 Tax=Vibrio coralliilyticus TaxID=190893 RepID=UPI0002F23682|nr:PilN domain-containing protein [Vibrio coralliilyticus]